MSTPRVFELLGSSLHGTNGKEVPTASILGPNKLVALYFSAHWCGPCRAFTPQLADVYRKFKATHRRAADWEVVFLSSDSDSRAFESYHKEMPWPALPYASRTAEAELSKLFEVQGIPTLVLVDGETGELVSKEGRSLVTGDPKCAKFPWGMKPSNSAPATPPTPAAAAVAAAAGPSTSAAAAASPPAPLAEVFRLLGPNLLGRGGEPVEAITGPNKVVGLYFSAHWCPPCRGFTPELARTYTRFKASHPRAADWEIVFVSSDRDQRAFDEYRAEMPWPALPFYRRDAKAALSARFQVTGIPTLVLLDGETGEVLTTEGREAVSSDPQCRRFPWGEPTRGSAAGVGASGARASRWPAFLTRCLGA